jgi:hypothetical protein
MKMKKLKLNLSKPDSPEVLTKDQLKNVLGSEPLSGTGGEEDSGDEDGFEEEGAENEDDGFDEDSSDDDGSTEDGDDDSSDDSSDDGTDDGDDDDDDDCDPSDPDGDCYDPCIDDPSGADCECINDPSTCANPCADDPTGSDCQQLCSLITNYLTSQSTIIQHNGSFQVPTAIAEELPEGFAYQTLSSATGADVNADVFEAHISTLPNGNTPDEFLEYFRLNLTDESAGQNVSFAPYNYDGYDYTTQWNESGTASLGALVHISMIDPGTVQLTQYLQDQPGANGHLVSSFTFTTVNSPEDGNHPVSGNRTFGIQTNSDGTYTFFISGVDRATTPLLNAAAAAVGWDDAKDLWTDVMNNVITYVNNNSGLAGNFDPSPDFAQQTTYTNIQNFLSGAESASELLENLGCPG